MPLALLNGLLFWLLSDDSRFMIEIVGASRATTNNFLPALFLLAAPLSAAGILLYFSAVGQRSRWRQAVLMRVLLPLTLIVLTVYLAFIPFRFREPFDNRDVLVIYNAMLFAVMALLVGATPVRLDELSPRAAMWLRRAIVGVAALAFVVSLYALAAILYRTALDRLTPNRLTFIGWNLINIALLGGLLLLQLRARRGAWLSNLHRTFRVGTVAYAFWAGAMLMALPWIFTLDLGNVAGLPDSVQRIVYEREPPILLKCPSPHIYLLQDGEKRWVRDIATFEAQGFVWRDVTFVQCRDLRAIPDGPPIPPDAGPTPHP